jgi:serine phosphatase RsbU (regulator of sigma subunit)
VRYRPAGSHQAVGGDWYDACSQPDGSTTLVIGDVVGHDAEATAAMSQARSMLRALAHDRPGSPAHILGRLDRVLTALQVGRMATALLARVEPGHGEPAHGGAGTGRSRMRWSSAGHVPPLLLRRDGEVRVLDRPPDRLLRAGWTGPRRDHEVPLAAGDTVLLVTDGPAEKGRCDIDRGLDRLAAVLAELVGRPVEELCDAVLDRILTRRADDDVALLALRCP